METKKCITCNEEKEIIEFLFKNTKNNIRHNSCKLCFKVIRKKSYNKNKEKTLLRVQKSRKNRTEWFKNYKQNLFCENCGENHPACLDFHHKNPKEKKHTISVISSNFSEENILKEIEKCIILCSNCHKKLHAKNDDSNCF